MRKEWQRYRREMLSYLRYFALGMALSLFPFLLNINNLIERGTVLSGLLYTLLYGFIVGAFIWTTFALVYAARIMLHLKAGHPVELSRFSTFLLGGFAAVCGTFSALLASNYLHGRKTTMLGIYYAFVVTGIFGVIFSLYHAYRQAKEKSLAGEAALSQARYQTLEHQMRPHFLFNALNSLAELIESKEETAAEMTYKLSDLYRQILQNSKTKTSSLSSEIEIAQRYLELEQLRFGPRLNFSFDAPSETDEIFLPSLMLQTLVENAIKHGVARSIGGGNVFVEIKSTENGLYRLSVTNTGEEFKQTSFTGNGLANTRERLELLYGNRHEFSIGPGASGETRASFFFTGEKID